MVGYEMLAQEQRDLTPEQVSPLLTRNGGLVFNVLLEVLRVIQDFEHVLKILSSEMWVSCCIIFRYAAFLFRVLLFRE